MAMTGKIPLKHRLNEKEINHLIMRGELGWIETDEKHPTISSEIKKESKGKRRKIYFSLWPTGTINIVGVIRKREANEVYEKVFNEIKNLCPRVLKNVHK